MKIDKLIGLSFGWTLILIIFKNLEHLHRYQDTASKTSSKFTRTWSLFPKIEKKNNTGPSVREKLGKFDKFLSTLSKILGMLFSLDNLLPSIIRRVDKKNWSNWPNMAITKGPVWVFCGIWVKLPTPGDFTQGLTYSVSVVVWMLWSHQSISWISLAWVSGVKVCVGWQGL